MGGLLVGYEVMVCGDGGVRDGVWGWRCEGEWEVRGWRCEGMEV